VGTLPWPRPVHAAAQDYRGGEGLGVVSNFWTILTQWLTLAAPLRSHHTVLRAQEDITVLPRVEVTYSVSLNEGSLDPVR